MGLTSTNSDTKGPTHGNNTNQATAPAGASLPNAKPYTSSTLGLLHDDEIGNHPTKSKDVAILRRLKLAILEAQHPYFKANIDLSNLQDLVLNPGSRPVGPGANQLSTLDSTVTQPSGYRRRNAPPALDDLGTSGPTILDYGNEDNSVKPQVSNEKSVQPSTTSAHMEDVSMASLDDSDKPESFDVNPVNIASGDPDSENKRPATQTLGRYILHSPIRSDSDSHMTHKRKLSDTPTLIDSNDQNTESEVQIKRESPPYQLSGSQSQELDPSSSSMASFVSNSTVSTGLTSDDGGATEGAQDANAELAGYDPKYGNKADYLRRQKVRSKAIESIEERTRRAGQRQDDKTIQKSPVRPTDAGSRHASGPSVSPVRGRDLPSRTYSVSSVPGLNGQDNNATLRRTPSVDLPPSQDFPTSPRGRVASSSLRSPSPTSGKYPHPHRDSSPAREYRPQYNPYDDPRSVRPRPIVSSPPRGSPPRESPAHRTAIELQSLDSYCNMYPRTETRSFDLRRSSSDMPGDNETNWPRMRRGAPPIQPPRSSPPPRDLIRERTSFGSGVLPANPNAGYRPEGLPEPPSARYSPYDATSRRVEWAARDWERPTDSKPKLQDRFTMDSQWRDSIESRRYTDYASRPLRDEFTHPTDSYGTRYRREPSPGAPRYADGFRSGFSRPVEVEGIRPMKRSRPDDSYPPRGGVNMEEFEGLDDHSSAFFRRKPAPSRRDDEYDPRLRPPY